MKTAFIGTGVMGAGMVRNLMKGGHELILYTRTKAKADPLLAEGASWADSPAEAAAGADAVITMVGYPEDVRQVYDEIIPAASEGTLLIDMTTSRPDLAAAIAAEAEKAGLHALDAPVSGGDTGARDGKLAIMTGGSTRAFTLAEPLFQLMGTNIQHLGDAGAGQYTKMANQISVASIMMAVSESLAYADKAGLDPRQVLETIETGAAGSFALTNLGRRMLNEDYEPGFYVKHFIKDMRIAIESAQDMGLELPGLTLAEKLYTELAENGEENAGTQALIKAYLS
ncbi:NAD(P)-dependent oxidoreductase [Alkalicoccus chagannorensis]|uniref:NAD(P)-dependent oxidoreductase n=1 Tax=Alkalicoccus chagannorensis TaxID=427072 RepID=UPI0003FFA7FE|nr:NAD(P)-dependent oxidoreductase [Alkalicoccus chagannorensis]